MANQAERAAAFRTLHERAGAFIIPNPWDAGSARLLANLGFEALATTSLGVANNLGTRGVSLDQIIDNCRAIADATDLPVNADLEKCGADDPREAAKAIALASAAGAVGGSIEDATGDRESPIYDFALAVDRVAAAVDAAQALTVPFVLTARAENFLCGRRDLDDTIKRLQAFEEVGADVLYAPGLYDLDTMKTVISSVSKPVNILMGFADPEITLTDLAEIGAQRISIGGALSRLAFAALQKSALDMRDQGVFSSLREAISMKDLSDVFQ